MDERFTTIKVLFFIILVKTTSGIVCHCNFQCGDLNATTCDTGASGACNVYLQSGEIFQTCLKGVLFVVNCNGELKVDESSSVPRTLCCRQDFCNTEDSLEIKLSSTTTLYTKSRTTDFTSLPSAAATSTALPSAAVTTTTAAWTAATTNLGGTINTTPPQPSLAPSTTTQQLCITCPQTITTTTTTSNAITATTTRASPLSATPVDSRIDDGSGPPAYAIAIIGVLAVLLAVFIVVILVVIFLHFYPRHVIGAMAVESDSTQTCTLSTECGELDDHNLLKSGFEGTTSGSGSGLPQLIQRSVAAQVTLKEVVGKGRFGEVRKGIYKGDAVAVKIFHTKEEASWNHEVDIYQTCLIRHPNILRFIAADNQDMGITTQLWLITEYCDYGSLYDVLQQDPLNEDMVLKLCYTTASGLAHLHSDIIGTEGKPAIAHRDLKTRNILVKSDFSCCLADLGLSLRYYRDTDKVEEPPTKRVGTRRYLSPEILNDTMDVNNFDCFKRSDMYSLGLVIWETARKGVCGDTHEEYQLPYFDLVSPDPSFEDMRKVVAIDKKRPTIPNRWSQSEVFRGLSQLMEQCWHHDGEARVTALRVKKNLSNLQLAKSKQKKTSITT